jgi:hypothetical protein
MLCRRPRGSLEGEVGEAQKCAMPLGPLVDPGIAVVTPEDQWLEIVTMNESLLTLFLYLAEKTESN